MLSAFTEKIYEIAAQIPYGKVAYYGQIALLAGNPRGARAVGFAMRNVKSSSNIPCHRVVFKDGSICKDDIFGGPTIQKQMLLNEGITFLPDGRIDMKEHCWSGLNCTKSKNDCTL